MKEDTRSKPSATAADTRQTPGRAAETRQTLGEVSHTHPYTGTVFGDTQTYARGKVIAADGGAAKAVDRPSSSDGVPAPDGGEATDEEDSPRDVAEETLRDVDHTPDSDVDAAQDTFDRGHEGVEESEEPDDPADE